MHDGGIVLQALRQLQQEVAHRLGGVSDRRGHVAGVARAAGIEDVLLALLHAGKIDRHLAARAEEIDLEHQELVLGAPVEHVLERGIGDDAAVPIRFAVDLDRRKGRRHGPARHDVLRPDHAIEIVETFRISGAHIDRAYRQAHLLAVDQVEIDHPAGHDHRDFDSALDRGGSAKVWPLGDEGGSDIG